MACVGLAGLLPPAVLPHQGYENRGQDEGPGDGSGYLSGHLTSRPTGLL